MNTVAILVAAYNAAATLPRCLDSLCSQTLHDIQIICIDDCSTDSTYSLLCQRASADPRITVLQTDVNSGHAVARNLGLRVADAEFACMLDADDWMSADCLEKAVSVFRAHKETDTVVLRLIKYYEDEQREEDYGLPAELLDGAAIDGMKAFRLCMDAWHLHGLYVTRLELLRRIPYDATTRLYSDDNTTRLHYLHSREVRACDGIYYYSRHPEAATILFHYGRFDFMEALFTLKVALRKEHIPADVMSAFEGERWYNYLACYRLYLTHKTELTAGQQSELKERFSTMLHTFRPSALKRRYRWKPGYWLTLSLPLFDMQQRAYLLFRPQR